MTPESFRKLPIIDRLEALSARMSSQASRAIIKQEFGLSRYELSHLCRLDRHLSDSTKHLISRNGLSEGHARALARLSKDHQDKVLRDTIQKRWSVRRLEQAVKAHVEGKELKETTNDAQYYQQLSNFISEQLGHPVKIQPAKVLGHGQLTISYFDLDSFDGILKRLRIKLPDDL